MMNNQDYYDYLFTFKNPLDKKFRWEVNTCFKQKKITDKQRKSLLALEPAVLYELSVGVRNKVGMDRKQIGNFYLNRAIDYNKNKEKQQTKRILFFHK